MFLVESDDSRGLSHSLWDGMEIVYSLFLLAAFGAIAVVVLCGRQMLKVYEFQSQALFVGGASETPKPRFVANSLRSLIHRFLPFQYGMNTKATVSLAGYDILCY